MSFILQNSIYSMVSKERLLEVLPVRDQIVLVEDRQNTSDIRAEILQAHRDYAADYDLIGHYFNTGNIVDTSRQIFDFLKANVPYTKENGKYQTVKSPGLILLANEGTNNYDRVDCKNYASFIAGVIDSIRRSEGGSDWNWTYRFASYNENDPEPGHVFVVVTIDDKELWIDPVFTYFNGGDMHEWELDQKPSIGGLYRISGPNDTTSESVSVNKEVAWTSFMFFVQQNIFSMRDLLTRYPQVTTTQLRAWCAQNGFDYAQLINFINHG
jgi:hypothetical protein